MTKQLDDAGTGNTLYSITLSINCQLWSSVSISHIGLMNGQDWRILKDSPDGFLTESKNIALQGLHVVRTGSARGPHGVYMWSARVPS